MTPQRNTFRLMGMTFLFAVFMSFTFLLPSVFAQEGDATPSPSETPSLPEGTPAPLEIPAVEGESGIQSFMSLPANAELGGDWAAQVNISDTIEESYKPKIAADGDGNLHIVWREMVSGKQEIYYTWMDVDKTIQSLPVNVSNSPSFNSDSPQIVVDSAGAAHIVWQEEDDNHGDDFETQYSNCQIVLNEQTGNIATCTTATILSDGQACGSFVGDWKSTDPSIGIDGNNNIMVAWMSFEPNPRLYTMYSLWSATGSPPSNRTGCNLSAGSFYYPVVAGDANGDFHLVRMNASLSIFYSKYSGGSWSANQTLGTGWLPVIHVDQNNKIHSAWWNTDVPPKYRSKESAGTTWSGTESVFASTICTDLSLITDENNLPRLACANGPVYEASRQVSGWTESVIIQSMGGPPDLVKDSNNLLHLVWSDYRSGSWDTFYSPTYTCEGISPATTAGQAVFNVVANTPFMNYCKNLVEEIIYVPAPNGQDDPNEAFQEWADLASSAKHEVAFTVMFWDKDNNSESIVPGEDVLAGIKQLYDEVTDEENENKYPHGMKVRILLGVQLNTLNLDSFHPLTDQRFSVLEQMQNLDIPIYETLPNGSAWKVEVGLYEYGLGSSNPPGIHSHVKLMVVDNNKMIVSGYHPQYGFQTNEAGDAGNHDLGIKVSGPIAANGMAVFDSLWRGSEILCTEEDALEFDIMDLGNCEDEIAENPTHWFFVPQGDDIALPLYRDHFEKTADVAVQTAIESALTQVYVLQNRMGVPGETDVSQYKEGEEWLSYADALLKEALENTDVRILISKENFNLNYYNIPSMKNFVAQYHQDCGSPNYQNCVQKDEKDLIRFYHPSENLTSPPGLHTKAFMIDEEFLVIGSQNFDHSAFGDNDDDLDLAEYSVGIENDTIISNFITDSDINDIWENSGKMFVIAPNESLATEIQQASAGDVFILEEGVHEISSTLNIPEGITLVGLGATIIPAQNFSNETTFKLASPSLQTTSAPLLKITGSNVRIIGLTIQDSTGYAIEIEDGVENIYLSNIVFENNALGGVYVQDNPSYTIENNTFVGGGSGVTIASNVNTSGTIRNNIFTGQTIAPIEITSADDGIVEYSYNLFDECDLGNCTFYWHVGDMSTSSTAHDNLFNVDPLFVNPSMGNYRLYPNSPAIDAGDPAILHEFIVDGNGDSELRIDIGAFEYGSIPNVAPVVTAGDDQTVELGNSVTVNAGYSDADNSENHFAQIDWGDGMVEDIQANTTSPGIGEVTGQHTYTSLGEYTVEICVTDLYGSVGCDTMNITATQQFTFAGFFQPVDNQPILNTVKAGSAIPIKFSLNGYQGLDIFFAGYPASAVVACGSSVEDAIEQTVTAGGSSLAYDATTDQYTYVWKTNKAWVNTCRTFVLRLSDGSYYRANFKLK